ncbi:MAG: lytic transglycosylase domain-containing protein, partial [Romboutsia sp.]|nr:lytic transglycosylase domain-containing protein [Romboutsia sp.]
MKHSLMGIILLSLTLNDTSSIDKTKFFLENIVVCEEKEVIKINVDSLVKERVLIAQQYQESRFKHDAKSYMGAVGVAQFMPATWNWVKKQEAIPQNASRTNPEHSIIAQKYYMDYLLGLPYINGDIQKALASYNCG